MAGVPPSLADEALGLLSAQLPGLREEAEGPPPSLPQAPASSCSPRILHLWEQLHLWRPLGGARGTDLGGSGCLVTRGYRQSWAKSSHFRGWQTPLDFSVSLMPSHLLGWPSKKARHISKQNWRTDSCGHRGHFQREETVPGPGAFEAEPELWLRTPRSQAFCSHQTTPGI